MAHPGAGVLIEGRARGKRLRYNLKLLYAGLNASAVLRTSAVVRGAAHCKPRDARYRPSLWCVPVPTRGNGAGALLSLSVASEVDQRRCCSVLLRPAARVRGGRRRTTSFRLSRNRLC